MKWAPWLIGALGLGVIAYGTYMRRVDPPTVIREGRLEIADPKGGDVKIAFKTRTVRGGGIATDQVELPGGTWIDCGGDCRDAVRKTTTDFWAEQARRR
jgi:hypothetical protein